MGPVHLTGRPRLFATEHNGQNFTWLGHAGQSPIANPSRASIKPHTFSSFLLARWCCKDHPRSTAIKSIRKKRQIFIFAVNFSHVFVCFNYDCILHHILKRVGRENLVLRCSVEFSHEPPQYNEKNKRIHSFGRESNTHPSRLQSAPLPLYDDGLSYLRW